MAKPTMPVRWWISNTGADVNRGWYAFIDTTGNVWCVNEPAEGYELLPARPQAVDEELMNLHYKQCAEPDWWQAVQPRPEWDVSEGL